MDARFDLACGFLPPLSLTPHSFAGRSRRAVATHLDYIAWKDAEAVTTLTS